jgi:small-conductance mechanosensitive channel
MSIDLGGEGDSGDSGGDGGSGGGQDSSGLSSPPYPLHSGLVNFWDSILVSIISIAASIAVYFIIRHLLKRTADSLNLDKRELKGINSITKMILIVINIIIIIFQFSSVSGVAAGAISVAAGTIIGFSSRNTISNAIAGILLLSSRPFKIGDRIRTTEDDSLVGDVIEISLLYTKIKTVRNELVAIPNQTLLQRQIVNYSGLDILATTIGVSAVYDNNRNKIESLLVEAAKTTDGIITDNPPPFVILKRYWQAD